MARDNVLSVIPDRARKRVYISANATPTASQLADAILEMQAALKSIGPGADLITDFSNFSKVLPEEVAREVEKSSKVLEECGVKRVVRVSSAHILRMQVDRLKRSASASYEVLLAESVSDAEALLEKQNVAAS